MAGFYEAARRYILQSVSSTFQTLPKATLAQSIKSDGTSLDNLVSRPWPFAACMAATSVIIMPYIYHRTAVSRVPCVCQIADKIASDGWNIGEDNVIHFPKRRVQQVQPQAARPSVQFEKLVPVLKLAA